MSSEPLSVSVIIVTLNRPDCVRRCLACLFLQEPQPDQIIVVDASPDDLTRKVVDDFPGVLYVRNENGYGRMTASRNIGLKVATGDIIAFLDDDAFAHSGWLKNLIATYTDSSIGAVGGRALNNQPGEATQGIREIGRLKSNGVLTGYFAADPGKVIEVDHVMGCNMSFRREVVARLGGFREDYPGISGVREDSDMCMRVRALDCKILFNPAACVDHIGAPQAKGKRFDARYVYYSQRNHLVLLIRNFGLGSGLVWRYISYSFIKDGAEVLKRLQEKRIPAAFARLGVAIGGTVMGLLSANMLLATKGRDPIRRDPEGQDIKVALQQNTHAQAQALADKPVGV